MSPLTGKVIAITGAARGIGFAIAQACMADGARISISDIDESALQEAADRLAAHHAARLDVTDPDGFGRYLNQVEAAIGPLDALVNNAGVMPTGPLLDLDDAMIRRIMEINSLGMIYGTKRALELMTPRGRGHVVNICSAMGEMAVPGLAVYNASKAAAVLFTDSTRLEHRATGVRVSAVLPGTVATELAAGLTNPPGIRVTTPEQVADAVVATLASEKSRPRVYVPALWGALVRGQSLAPKGIHEAFMRLLGSDTAVLRPKDPAARASYLDRVRKS